MYRCEGLPPGRRLCRRSRNADIQDRLKEVENRVVITGDKPLFRGLASKQLVRRVQPFTAVRQFLADFLSQLCDSKIAFVQEDAVRHLSSIVREICAKSPLRIVST